VNAAASSTVSLEFDVLNPSINLPPPFISQLAFLNVCSWGNNNAVMFNDSSVRYLMHCTDLSLLMHDVSYGVKGIQVVVGTPVPVGYFVPGTVYTITSTGNTNFVPLGAANSLPGTVFTAISPGTPDPLGGYAAATTPISVLPSEVKFLLAKDPYDFQDKELNAFLDGASFNSSFTFTFGQDKLTGIYKLTAPQSVFTQLLHPLVPEDPSSSTLFTAQSTAGATTPASTLSHKYIIGPT
jgi:hypothetical protein